MSYSNTNGFRGANVAGRRGAGIATQAMQQNMQYEDQQFNDPMGDDPRIKRDRDGFELPFAYLNLKAPCEDGQSRSVGKKGIPLYITRPVDAALIELMFDEAGNRTDVDMLDVLDMLEASIELANANAPAAKPSFVKLMRGRMGEEADVEDEPKAAPKRTVRKAAPKAAAE